MVHGILKSVGFQTHSLKEYSWALLRRFHDTEILTNAIMSMHSMPANQKRNANKRAQQIRYCLMQAREYRDASEQVGLGTKPVLLYYSVLSLALAQILLKGPEMYSLDKMRGINAHHGLVFSKTDTQKSDVEFKNLASSLRSKPVTSGTERKGTFELWHSIAREFPIVGVSTNIVPNGKITNYNDLIFNASNERQKVIDKNGLTFLEILLGLPCMREWLEMHGVNSATVRGSVTREVDKDKISIKIVIHPANKIYLDNLLEEFSFRPDTVENISIVEFPSGLALTMSYSRSEVVAFAIPEAAAWTNREVRFLDPRIPLNEFGLHYFGLHILSNYARYYPEKWMKDIEVDSSLAHAVETFLEFSVWQIAFLAASELSQTYWVREV